MNIVDVADCWVATSVATSALAAGCEFYFENDRFWALCLSSLHLLLDL